MTLYAVAKKPVLVWDGSTTADVDAYLVLVPGVYSEYFVNDGRLVLISDQANDSPMTAGNYLVDGNVYADEATYLGHYASVS